MEFKLADAASLEKEARARAMANAEEKAVEIADLAGLRPGRITSVNEIGDTPVGSMEGLGGSRSMGIGSISPGELGVSATIQVVYELE